MFWTSYSGLRRKIWSFNVFFGCSCVSRCSSGRTRKRPSTSALCKYWMSMVRCQLITWSRISAQLFSDRDEFRSGWRLWMFSNGNCNKASCHFGTSSRLSQQTLPSELSPPLPDTKPLFGRQSWKHAYSRPPARVLTPAAVARRSRYMRSNAERPEAHAPAHTWQISSSHGQGLRPRSRSEPEEHKCLEPHVQPTLHSR